MSNLEKLRTMMVRSGLAADSIREAASEQILPFGDLIFGDDDPSVDGVSCGLSCTKCDEACESGCKDSCKNGNSKPT